MAAQTEDQLTWEGRQRPRAALAAILAGVLTLAAGIINGLLFADAPRVPLLDALGRALQAGPAAEEASLRVPFYEFYDDRSPALLGTSVARAAGLVATGWALTFLASATRARREMARPALYVGLVGALLAAIATVLSTIASTLAVQDFLDGPRTVAAADDLTQGSLLVTAQFIGLAGALGLGLGFVFVALNAMRAGLLTRFMGVLGIITGVLVVIPIGSPLPIVQSFWLIALGALLLGRWPNGEPPAWRTGRAEPWPSTRRVRGEPAARPSRGKGRGAPQAPPPEPVPAGDARPASRRRKRKRRN